MAELVLFPGQGAQYSGMAKDLYDSDAKAKKVLDDIFSAVDFDLKSIMFEEDERLNQTQYTQPALFAHSLAVLAATGIKGDYALGHSLGELPALVHAGVVTLEDGVKLVVKRGALMSESKEGSMAAVIGLSYDEIKEVCEELSNEDARITPANINAPDQIVISGDRGLIDSFQKLAKERGARRIMPLKVSGAFHSHLMENAKSEFKKFVDSIDFKKAEIPIIQNVSARPETDPDLIREQLVEQVTNPVRFVECVETAKSLQVTEAVEVGPKKVLCGLVRKIDREISTKNIGTLDEVKEYNNG